MLAPTAPTPPNVTVAAVAIEAELTVSVPVAAPLNLGVNDTPTVQLAAGANDPVQVYCVQLNPWLTATVRAEATKVLELVIVTV
jgi:hypothetical protein